MRARLSNLQEQLREKDDQFREKDGINLNLQTRLNTKNQQLEEKIRQENNLYLKAQLREKESEKANLFKERDRQNGNLRAMHQLKTKMKEQLERKEQKLVESELRSATERSSSSDQRERQSNSNSLGRGRKEGSVVVSLLRLILSPHNRRLFEREIDIASRCRHPCLLQFIGATNDDHTHLCFYRGHENKLASTVTGKIFFTDRNPRYCFGCGSTTKLPPSKTPHPYSSP